MMNNATKGLFGGALLSAGLMTGAANAQQFQVGYTAAHAYAFTGSSVHAYQYGSGPFILNPVSSNNYGDAASAYMNFGPGGLGASVSAFSAYGYVIAHSRNFVSYFTVDQPFNSTVAWDFTQAGGFFNNYLQIDDMTNGGNLLFQQSFSNGSQQVAFSPNTQYRVIGLLDVGLTDGKASTWWNMAVPAPGSAALLAVAGIAATRRRR
jgi:hypothetical protein